ncbi:MAG: peptidyl-prolyl cis-trans isomerase, partial [Bacteroidetes bacterium]
MGLGNKFLREPLLHFLLIGAALFAVYYITRDKSYSDKSKDIIVISSSDINRLAYFFEKTWRRPPNDKELRGIVDDYLEEEVLYREALRLGLD